MGLGTAGKRVYIGKLAGTGGAVFGVIGGAQGHEILAAVREHGLAHLLQRGLEALASLDRKSVV